MQMVKRFSCILPVLAALGVAQAMSAPRPKPPEINDPAQAAKDADFAVQGEYLGQADLGGGLKGRLGVQVIARGGGKFEAYLLPGGLPGDGWKRGDPRVRIEGERKGGVVTLSDKRLTGKIESGKLTLTADQGKAVLERIERKSPTLGQRPPAGAVVLFDGNGLTHFEKDAHKSPDNNLMAGTVTKDKINDYTLHLEFRLSWMPTAAGQARSNSGVYVHDCYEIQVLDSFGLSGENNECGGFYRIKAPDVNMCFPPMTWQTFDVEMTAPKYDAAGQKTANARITVRHNGVLIHDRVGLPNATPGRQKEGPGPRPIHLQGHGNKVEYRNIWVQKK